jgi:hypothetical protein
MPKKKRRNKPPPTPTGRSHKPATVGLLERLGADELAAVLRSLLRKHPDLKRDAESMATAIVSSPSVEDIADEVCNNLTSLDVDELSGRAGKHSWGYVEPGQAAQDLLEEAVAESIADMNRRMDLGLEAASEAICVGIVSGLFRASSESPCRLLEWAPDFPVEHACFVVEECVRRYHAAKRRAAADRLISSLSGVVPEWSEMISKVARRAARG